MKLARDTFLFIFVISALFMSSCSDFQQDSKNLTTFSTEIDQVDAFIDKLPILSEEHRKEARTFCRAIYEERNDSLIWFSSYQPDSDAYFNSLKNDTLLGIPFGYLPVRRHDSLEQSSIFKEIYTLLKTSYYLNARQRGIFDQSDNIIAAPELPPVEDILTFIRSKPDKKTWKQHLFDYTTPHEKTRRFHRAMHSFFSAHPVTDDTWDPDGDSLSDALVRKRLSALGFSAPPSRFKEQLQRFQWFHGLQTDAIAGSHTIEALSMTNLKRYHRAVIQLDRYYQMQDSVFPDQYIRINIPAFELCYFYRDTIVYQSSVVVGRKKSATPTFQAPLRYIVTNPFWHLPHSIASRETLYKIKKDTAIITEKGYEIIHNQKPIATDTIDWKRYHQNNFPYRILQRPGPKNSLGKIKFIFPNRYNVYVHDTPQRHLFSKSRKTFSHGCIRLQNPTALADNILSIQEHPYRDSLDTLFDKRTETYLHLEAPFPVIVDYQTVVRNDSAKSLRFYYDIYERDTFFLEKVRRKFN